jgi:hypothetical protein
MDGETIIPGMPRDEELNKALKFDDAEVYDDLAIRNQRLARIQEYEESALARRDPLAAVIGLGNADFQRIFECLGTAVLEQLEAGSKSIEEIRELEPEIRLLVKIRKAIETDVALQAREAEQQPSALPRCRNSKELEGRPGSRFKHHLPRH